MRTPEKMMDGCADDDLASSWKDWPEKIDVFISRAGPDKAIAQWIATELISAGNSVVLQDWDFEPGDNFILNMHEALRRGAAVIACLSGDYLKSRYCALEWSPAIRAGKLIPVRVAPCEPDGVLGAYAYLDLFRVPASQRRQALISLVERGPTPRPERVGSINLAQLPVHNMEYWEVEGFRGRDIEIHKLAETLWGKSSAAVTSTTIQGHGGVGKSSLAREYARRFRDHYDYVWWISAAEADSLVESLAALAAKLDPAIDQDKAKKELSQRARYAVDAAGRDPRPWLLIFDNCEDPTLLKRWMPQGGAHCLVTSRLQAWPPTMGRIDLAILPSESAISMLADLSERAVNADLVDLATELGGLPLAINHAAALLRQNALLSPRELKLQLTGYLKEKPRWTDYPFAAVATFRAAVERIEKNGFCDAMSIVGLASIFEPDNVAIDDLSTAYCLLPHDLREKLTGQSLDPDHARVHLRNVLGESSLFSLVRFNNSNQPTSFALHRLVGAVAREELQHRGLASRVLAPAIDMVRWRRPAHAHSGINPLDLYDHLEIVEKLNEYVTEAEQEAREAPWRAASLIEWCGDAVFTEHLPDPDGERSHWASEAARLYAQALQWVPDDGLYATIRRSNLFEKLGYTHRSQDLFAVAEKNHLAALDLRQRYPDQVPHLILRSAIKLAELKEAQEDFTGALEGYKAASEKGAILGVSNYEEWTYHEKLITDPRDEYGALALRKLFEKDIFEGKDFPYDDSFCERPSNVKIKKLLAAGLSYGHALLMAVGFECQKEWEMRTLRRRVGPDNPYAHFMVVNSLESRGRDNQD